MPATFSIDLAKPLAPISPLCFGHNLEHTRSCLWHGLSAQLLRNRKFMGMPAPNGVAEDWYPIGQSASRHVLEIQNGWQGTDGEPYTGHFDPESPPDDKTHPLSIRLAGQRQRIESPRPGARSGIGQSAITLIGNRSYQLRAALRSDRPLTATLSIIADKPHQTRVHVTPDAWTEHTFDFTIPQTIADARLEIAFDAPGNLFIGAVSLLPAENFLGLRPDVIQLLQEIGTPMLRWPGGNFAGDYLWRDGLLPVDRRAAIKSDLGTLPHTHSFDTHEIGTDEFIALCRELSAEPFLTINMSLEGPEDAAAWVEYCNGSADSRWGRRRAQRGHPKPYGVKYWTLGNEMGYAHMKGPNAPAQYAQAAAACARAMRNVDPSLILVASASPNAEWYEVMLAATDENFFDHLSYHVYHAGIKSYMENAHTEFQRLADLPSHTFFGTGYIEGKQNDRLTFPDMRRLINDRPRGRKNIGIAFDEWNVWYAWYRTPGIPEAIHGALMLNLFCREAVNVGMTLGSFFQPVNEGAILVNPESARLTPLGKVMNLFQPHHGARLLAADTQSPDATLDLTASLRPDQKEITITLVNRSPDQNREVEIILRNAPALGAAHAVLLSAPDFLPGTDFSASHADPLRPRPETLFLTVPKHSVTRITLELR